MNISTIIGIACSFTVFIAALFTSAKNHMVFLDVHAILIVIGGTASASLVCFSLPKVLGLTKVFVKRMLGTNKRDYPKLITQISMLSAAMKSGKSAFEQAINKVDDLFLKDAAQVLFWLEADIKGEQLRDLLDTRAETHFQRYMQEADYFRVISKFPPAFGLMGTTLGMISLLQALGDEKTKNSIGPSMAIALVATLYGIVLANFVFIPISENLTQQTQEDLIARRMIIEGVMLIQEDLPTMYIEEKVKSYLLPSERGDAGPSRPSAPKKNVGKAA